MQPQPPMPRWLWLIPFGIAALRVLPWLASRALDPLAADQALLEMGFLPKDTLQYLAFAQQTATDGGWLLANPFTTTGQDDRFLLPLLSLLGSLAAQTGTAIITWLELSRFPLLLVYFAVLWKLLAGFFPDPRERALTCVLVGLAGGLEVLVKPLGGALPVPLDREMEQATWQMSGWSLFAASANPLWIAGAAGSLALLRPILTPTGAISTRTTCAIAGGLFALYIIHPYSAVAVLAIALSLPALALALWIPPDWARWRRLGLAVATGTVLIGCLATWQRADPVFAESAGSALGTQQLSPFWYPLVLGGLCVLALRGARTWVEGTHPMRFALLAWLLTAVFLHTSTLLNGYHFASQLHLPLCILAAPAFFEAWHGAQQGRRGARVLCAVTLAAPLLMTAESITRIRTTHIIPAETSAIIATLEARPAGNVLVGARLGNVLPAYTQHRVYVGHHFLTPEYNTRRREIIALSSDPAQADALTSFVRDHRIRYALLPRELAASGIATLTPLATKTQEIGRYTLLELGAPG